MLLVRLFLMLSVSLFVSACANQVPLTGGPKDEIPPQLDTLTSTKNFQTQFAKQEIQLNFDEYVDLKDANQQIVISPPLDFPPLISSRLRKVKIEFSEEEILKENATYVINFGKSIKDFTEGNELLNFTYVFSTGDYIDSLSIEGKVIDAKTQKPKKDALVMLYIDHSDSVVYNERPFYFSQTDDNGIFQLNNLRADTFRIVTLVDKNVNYKYDGGDEEIGFLDTLYVLNDTISEQLELELFKERTSALYKGYTPTNKGLISLEYDAIPDLSKIRVLDSIDHLIQSRSGQNLLELWYFPRERRSFKIEIDRGDQLDTVLIRINQRNVDTLAGRIDITGIDIDPKTGVHPLDSLGITFDRPLRQIDPTLIYAVDTSKNDTVYFEFDTMPFPKLDLELYRNWNPERELELNFMPGALTDFYGKNNDTLVKQLYVALEEDFGGIKFHLNNFDSVQYVFILKNKDKVVAQFILFGDKGKVEFDRLVPATYTLEIITDEIENGRWDPGNYLDKRQSERIYEVPLEPLRANWLMEEVLDLLQIIDSSNNQETETEETQNN